MTLSSPSPYRSITAHNLAMDGTDPASALTFSEITDLNKRKLELKATNTAYLSSHPEVRSMLNDFMSSCLLDKPDDVYGFAKEFFAEMRPEHSLAQGVGGWQPVVICGPSGVGKQTLINLLVVQYSQKFGFTIQHTTRPPRPGEDSSDYHFITLDEMQQGIEDGKFLEYSNGEEPRRAPPVRRHSDEARIRAAPNKQLPSPPAPNPDT